MFRFPNSFWWNIGLYNNINTTYFSHFYFHRMHSQSCCSSLTLYLTHAGPQLRDRQVRSDYIQVIHLILKLTLYTLNITK